MKPTDEKKEHGAHFTPTAIANFIAKTTYNLIENAPETISVLDPSCGDGELLIAALKHLHKEGHQVKLVGVDTNKVSLDAAQKRIKPHLLEGDELRLQLGNFLSCKSEGDDSAMFEDIPESPLISKVDMLIANPPYVRTQVLGSKVSQKIAKSFKLTGKTDLYHAFFLNYSRFLKENGALGAITSNRYLYTKSGEQVRKHLHENFKMNLIIDLGDTKVFSAAVLPALLFAVPGCNNNHKVDCLKIYERERFVENCPSVTNVLDIIEKGDSGFYTIKGKCFKSEWGHIRNTSFSNEPWILASKEQEEWLDAVDAASACRISDIAKVRVGIKTTADKVFIRENWDDLPLELRPEEELIYPLISSKDTKRWKLDHRPALSIVYPHYTDEDGKRAVVPLEPYPHLKSYLNTHYDQLNGRNYIKKARRKWYEIWVPQNPSSWKSPKIVFPDISSNARFLIDLAGCLVDGNCYWIQPIKKDDADLLYLILGVANSSLMDTYHSLAFQNVLYSGKRRYLAQYVNRYPLPNLENASTRKLIKYVKQCLLSENSCSQRVVDSLVFESFGVADFKK